LNFNKYDYICKVLKMSDFKPIIETPWGDAKLDSIKVSELGFVQLKIWLIDKRIFKTFTIDKVEDILSDLNFKIK
jgi:hypothetical protein